MIYINYDYIFYNFYKIIIFEDKNNIFINNESKVHNLYNQI